MTDFERRRTHGTGRRLWWSAVAAIGVASGMLFSACVLFDDGGPESALVTIAFEAGDPGAGSDLQLIVSDNFTTAGVQGRTDVMLRSADTIRLNLPFQQQYSLGSDSRFFAQIANLDSIPVVLSVRVELDGDVRMDQVSALGEPVEFLYILREF